jgi:hypothetical protein
VLRVTRADLELSNVEGTLGSRFQIGMPTEVEHLLIRVFFILDVSYDEMRHSILIEKAIIYLSTTSFL